MTSRAARIGAVVLLLAVTACEPGHTYSSSAGGTTWSGTRGHGHARHRFRVRPILVEDFRGHRLDPRRWETYHSPHARTHPRSRDAVEVRGGTLRLTGGTLGGRDVSGGVASLLDQRYGRWQVRMRVDRGGGYSPVALLAPERPGTAEVGFVELADPARRVNDMSVRLGRHGETARREVSADFTRWRTVTVDWLPDRLTIWVDGRRVWSRRGRSVPRRGRMGLVLQNDVVCCRTAGTPEKVTMYVDWVRIYRMPG